MNINNNQDLNMPMKLEEISNIIMDKLNDSYSKVSQEIKNMNSIEEFQISQLKESEDEELLYHNDQYNKMLYIISNQFNIFNCKNSDIKYIMDQINKNVYIQSKEFICTSGIIYENLETNFSIKNQINYFENNEETVKEISQNYLDIIQRQSETRIKKIKELSIFERKLNKINNQHKQIIGYSFWFVFIRSNGSVGEYKIILTNNLNDKNNSTFYFNINKIVQNILKSYHIFSYDYGKICQPILEANKYSDILHIHDLIDIAKNLKYNPLDIHSLYENIYGKTINSGVSELSKPNELRKKLSTYLVDKYCGHMCGSISRVLDISTFMECNYKVSVCILNLFIEYGISHSTIFIPHIFSRSLLYSEIFIESMCFIQLLKEIEEILNNQYNFKSKILKDLYKHHFKEEYTLNYNEDSKSINWKLFKKLKEKIDQQVVGSKEKEIIELEHHLNKILIFNKLIQMKSFILNILPCASLDSNSIQLHTHLPKMDIDFKFINQIPNLEFLPNTIKMEDGKEINIRNLIKCNQKGTEDSKFLSIDIKETSISILSNLFNIKSLKNKNIYQSLKELKYDGDTIKSTLNDFILRKGDVSVSSNNQLLKDIEDYLKKNHSDLINVIDNINKNPDEEFPTLENIKKSIKQIAKIAKVKNCYYPVQLYINYNINLLIGSQLYFMDTFLIEITKKNINKEKLSPPSLITVLKDQIIYKVPSDIINNDFLKKINDYLETNLKYGDSLFKFHINFSNTLNFNNNHNNLMEINN